MISWNIFTHDAILPLLSEVKASYMCAEVNAICAIVISITGSAGGIYFCNLGSIICGEFRVEYV